MNNYAKTPAAAVLVCWIVALSAANAHAYIDPTATAIVIQVVAGIFISAGLAVKIFWGKIAGIFRKSGSKNAAE